MKRRIDDYCGLFGLAAGGFLFGAMCRLYSDEPTPLAVAVPVLGIFFYGLIWFYRRYIIAR